MFLYSTSGATEPALTFGLLLLIILFIPLLFQKLKLPGIVGLLLAGTAIGPLGTGLIDTGGTIDLLGRIGLLYLMFLAGLEIRLDQLRKERKHTLIFGTLTFLIPQTMGTLIFFWMGYPLLSSLLVGCMIASHTLIAYPLISRLGLKKEKSVIASVGATILTDVVALLVLAVLARSVEGELNTQFWITLTGLFCLYLIFMFKVLPRISFRFFQYIGEKGQATWLYVIGMMLIASWLAGRIGIEAIIGAFFAGLAFNPLLSNKGPLKNRIVFFGDAFFIPLFLLYVGMQVDIRVLAGSSDVWIVISVLTFTVIAAKWLAAFIYARLVGFTRDQAWVAFGLTTPQAAATLATVFVGMEVGLIGEEILNGAIMTILASCIIGPVAVDHFGYRLTRKRALEGEKDAVSTARQQILVPLANPATIARLIEFASNIKTDTESAIFPLSIINTYKNRQGQEERAKKTLEQAGELIHAVNSRANLLLETNLNIASGIHAAAERNSITDIVIGWDGKISTRVRVFGSIIDQVLEATRQQVFVCKLDRPVATFERVRIVVSPRSVYSNSFLQLLGTLLHLAENLNTEVEIYHIAEEEEQIKNYLNFLSSSLKVTRKQNVHFNLLWSDSLRELQDSDLLVVTNERRGNYGWVYGTNLVPRMLSAQKPDVSFVIAYPGSTESGTGLADMLYPG